MQHVGSLPWQAWLAAVPIVFGGAWKAARALYRWLLARSGHVDELVDLLRKALDKGRIRESALASVLDLAIFAIDHIEDPSPAIVELRSRMTDVLELAHGQLQQINRGSHE